MTDLPLTIKETQEGLMDKKFSAVELVDSYLAKINKYNKELSTSIEIAKKYRERINPTKTILPNKDVDYIKIKIVNKVKAELMLRISKGYKNINLNLIENMVDKVLKDLKII